MRKVESFAPGVFAARPATLAAVLVAVVVLLPPTSAHAIADHLTCYAIKDPQPRATYSGTLLSFPADDTGGGVFHPGCQIRLPAKLLCQATSKSLVDPVPPGAADGIQQPHSFLCYKVKCPGELRDVALTVHDQFGARTVMRRVPKVLCAPAAGPTTTSTTTTTTTSTTSTSMPPAATCAEASPLTCNGPCPPGSVCTATYDGQGWLCVCQTE